jgi:hypothetical protein
MDSISISSSLSVHEPLCSVLEARFKNKRIVGLLKTRSLYMLVFWQTIPGSRSCPLVFYKSQELEGREYSGTVRIEEQLLMQLQMIGKSSLP